MLCDSLEVWGWGAVGREPQEGGDVLYLWLIHTVVQQKPTQHHKATVLQLKSKNKQMIQYLKKEYDASI